MVTCFGTALISVLVRRLMYKICTDGGSEHSEHKILAVRESRLIRKGIT